ncbi:uncharacterized protein EKO05_0000830 [Ascochyta rabiei]|uniref:uncharacterized protein n=1 Tax=Didymella rabiei TaxID=5454 RepID=UPI002208CEA5|nr:uncharacterized protein EKO05_0000830 [Ascochyta rabiei]UPX10159.1 hypothetical protein EKO05_0000830 [Ascochyta rabiei]
MTIRLYLDTRTKGSDYLEFTDILHNLTAYSLQSQNTASLIHSRCARPPCQQDSHHHRLVFRNRPCHSPFFRLSWRKSHLLRLARRSTRPRALWRSLHHRNDRAGHHICWRPRDIRKVRRHRFRGDRGPSIKSSCRVRLARHDGEQHRNHSGVGDTARTPTGVGVRRRCLRQNPPSQRPRRLPRRQIRRPRYERLTAAPEWRSWVDCQPRERLWPRRRSQLERLHYVQARRHGAHKGGGVGLCTSQDPC